MTRTVVIVLSFFFNYQVKQRGGCEPPSVYERGLCSAVGYKRLNTIINNDSIHVNMLTCNFCEVIILSIRSRVY